MCAKFINTLMMTSPVHETFPHLPAYLEALEAWIKSDAPQCVLIPTKNNFDPHTKEPKCPAFIHKGVPHEEMWDLWERKGRDRCDQGICLILRGDLIVMDVDDHSWCDRMEKSFPEITRTVIQRTKKGKHYFFKRTPGCDSANLLDGARQILSGTGQEKVPIDIKTVTGTGTGGVVVLCPSKDKHWQKGACFSMRETMLFPDRLLQWIMLRRASSSEGGEKGKESSNSSHKSVIWQKDKDIPLLNLLMPLLGKERATHYEDWIRVGWALKSVAYDHSDHERHLLGLWIKFSEQASDKFAPGECERLWSKMPTRNDDGFTIASLIYWAKKDDPDKARTVLGAFVQEREIQRLVDLAAQTASHFDMARVAHYAFGDTVKYATTNKSWYIWSPYNGLWVKDMPGHRVKNVLSFEVAALFSERMKDLYNQAAQCDLQIDSERFKAFAENCAKAILRLKDANYKRCVTDEMKNLMFDDAFVSHLNLNALFGFNNGVYDFDALEFRKGRPEDMVCLSTGYDFPSDGEQQTPEFMEAKRAVYKTVREPHDTDEMGDYILKVIASYLDGKKRAAEFFIWTGQGANGKTCVSELVYKSFGPYAEPLSVSFWTSPRAAANQASPEIASVASCRFVFSTESNDMEKLRVDKIKEFTGGDMTRARGLYEGLITFAPKFGVAILANNMPEIDRIDGGIMRRIRIVPFKNQFKDFPGPGERQADPTVLENCKTNKVWWKAFMMILIDKYKELPESLSALPQPQQVREATEAYLEDNNKVGLWIKRYLEFTNNHEDRVATVDLLNQYKFDTGDGMMNGTAFKGALIQNGVLVKTARIRSQATTCALGIKERPRILDDVDEDA